ncbi:MAG: SRPBCC family protein [Sphingobium sp.]|uniref:SRPBCC family protein n=1 Tax=Sphingobium sp. TaxID=1912891 RepID=UPI0029A89C63|nr:SRPBCC family protein [Sphingobium sp.]MDX3911077.1 SRPBCC family protein [Sphingobium sp.]
MSDVHDDAPLALAKDRDDRALAAADAGGDESHSVVIRTVTINRPRSELYAYWRDFSKLSTFMDNVERVDIRAPDRSHWVVKAPAGKTVEWDARITEDVPDECIAWEADEKADVPNSGRVEFADAQGDRGTIVRATIAYDPPAGVVGKVIAKLFQREPAIQARRDLHRFKQLMETGEISTAARTRAERAKEEE